MYKKDLYLKIEEGYSTRQLAEHFNCSQTNIRHWLKRYNLTTNKNKLRCIICNANLRGNQRKYCSNNCKSKGFYNSSNGYYKQTQKVTERKLKLVTLKGGKCSLCGYNKNLAALEFHHVDSNLKQFSLDARRLGNNSWKTIITEAEKCILFCSNCHREHHYPEMTLTT